MLPTSLLRALFQLVNSKLSLLTICILALGLLLASPVKGTDLLQITPDPNLSHETSGNGNGIIEPGESGEIGFRVTSLSSQRMHFDFAHIWSYDSSYVTGYTFDGERVWYPDEVHIFYVQFDVYPDYCGGDEVEVYLQIFWAIPYRTGDTTGSGKASIGYLPSGTTNTFNSYGPSVAIPDDSETGVDIPLDVSGMARIADLDFIINGGSCTSTPGAASPGLDHPAVHDLVLKLTSPQGTTVTLMDRPGGSTNAGSNFCNTVLDENSSNPLIQSITTDGAPYPGTFNPANSLSAFIGEDPNGTWTLNVSDHEITNTGQVNAFSLLIVDESPICHPPTYQNIFGHVSTNDATAVSGVALRLTGSGTATAQSDINGIYTFGNRDRSGSYTVTPYKFGYIFNPVRRYFSVLDTDTEADFIATETNFSISGRVLRAGSAAGLSGVTMNLIGDRMASATTDANGAYTFPDLPASGNYMVGPSIIGYRFTPASLSYSNLSANQTDQNFTARLQTYTVGGIVRLGAARLEGVTITLSSLTPTGFATRTATTNSNGVYSFTGLPSGRDYKVRATKTGYQFLPVNQSLTNLSANLTAVNFAVKVYSISGRVTKPGGTVGISAVTIALTSPSPAGFAARTVQTSSTGNYTFTNVPAGRSYTLKPTKTGLTFTPVTRSITNLHADIPVGTATSFTGKP